MANAETTERIRRKRPIGVWVITILYAIALIPSLYFANIPFDSFPDDPLVILDLTFSTFPIIIAFMSIVLLFMLNRFSFHFFMGVFIWNLLYRLYRILYANWLNENGSAEFAAEITYVFISVTIILYIRSLIKKGILS